MATPRARNAKLLFVLSNDFGELANASEAYAFAREEADEASAADSSMHHAA